MRRTIEKYSIWIQITTLVSIFALTIWWTRAYSQSQNKITLSVNNNSIRIANIEKEQGIIYNTDFWTRLSVVEEKVNTQQQYLYNFKSEIKAEVKEVNWKVDQVINILLKK